jgi:hypothetical protein
MDDHHIAALRLHHHQLAHTSLTSPEAVVRWMGAMQAQDYRQALWGIGVRLPSVTAQQVEGAIAELKIIRTWAMRGTLHFVPAEDAKWMLNLMAVRVLAQSGRRQQQLELDAATFARCDALFVRLLEGGKRLTRSALLDHLEAEGIRTGGQRGYHILTNSAQRGLIAITAMDDKEQTFALLDECAPNAPSLSRDEALVEITRRYFRSHAPATAHDLAWWTGLTLTDARKGIADLGAALRRETLAGTPYWFSAESAHGTSGAPRMPISLLPAYDEYLLGYQNRAAILDPQFADKVCPGGNGVFQPMIVAEGQIVGIWKRTFKQREITITYAPFTRLSPAHTAACESALERFGAFWKMPTRVQ